MILNRPLRALSEGLLAGLAGSLAQTMFFRATSAIAPSAPPDAFQPPPDEKPSQGAAETVARRSVEGLARRGPLQNPSAAAQVVHYTFGSGWGGLYGVWLGTRAPAHLLRSGAAFGLLVWMASDNVLLPVFRLGGWPWRYPASTHLYAAAAHIAYGGTVSLVYAAAQKLPDNFFHRQQRAARNRLHLPGAARAKVRRIASKASSFVHRRKARPLAWAA